MNSARYLANWGTFFSELKELDVSGLADPTQGAVLKGCSTFTAKMFRISVAELGRQSKQ